ncbi:MAG TPA: STAS domain-containing protein [Gemmatimonadales bacterium]|nr:STAS domain-containing protein [Gemmatimonadales bacterium]
MKIDAAREREKAVLRLDGRLDREGAEQLSASMEELLRDGIRWLTIDFSTVSYISSAATKVLNRWQQELSTLRGSVKLTAMSPALQATLAVAGWEPQAEAGAGTPSAPVDLRMSSWQLRPSFQTTGHYQMTEAVADATLECRLHGRPDQLAVSARGPAECPVVELPTDSFALGLGSIGGSYDECRELMGELIAVAGCVAYFPSGGARMADYLVADGQGEPRAVLASGLSCRGGFSKLVRFSAQGDADSVPFSEVSAACLDASGGDTAGIVLAVETAGLVGARLRRSPAGTDGSPVQFGLPAIRDWLSFAPEKTYAVTTTLIAGVVSRAPEARLAPHLRPLSRSGKRVGHFHAAVFSYRPLPRRTVEMGALVRGFFRDHQLRDVLHLLRDDRMESGVGESTFVRGVGWIAPISQVA